MERVENLLRILLSPGVGSVTINRLLEHFGTSDRVLGASETELQEVKGIRKNQIAALRQASDIDPRPELDLAATCGVNLITYDHPSYPHLLKSMYDPPCVLYVKGTLKPDDGLSLGIVGTRRASLYGRQQAERFAGLLGHAGFCICSGLARGIDSFAHKGSLAAGARTLAVLGCGLNHIYPEENRDLAAEITENGALVSEFPMDTGPSRENFPRRNRIIAGLSLGVLVVEAPVRSGALITARHALEMNRDVFAIPGRIDQENTSGCHRLIRDGATLVRNLDDILETLGPVGDALQAANLENPSPPVSHPAVSEPQQENASPTSAATSIATEESAEARILSVLAEDPLHIDQICLSTGLPVSEISRVLMILEIQQKVIKQPGMFFVRGRG